MATIESYFLADGSKRYRVRYRTPERHQTDKRGFKTKHEAADFAASVEVAKLQGLYVQPSHGKLLTGPWVVDWLAGRGDLARSSQVRYEGIINEHIVPKWGKVALADVRHIDIQRWCTDLTRKGPAAATVDKVHRVLSQVLDLAVRDQRIPRNPANGVKIARPNISPRRYLTHAQVERFAQAADAIADRPKDELVFRSRKGTVLRVGNARPTWWNTEVVEAELPSGFHPHELRHTAASLAISAGANVKAVQQMLGHKSASLTLDTYANLFQDDLTRSQPSSIQRV